MLVYVRTCLRFFYACKKICAGEGKDTGEERQKRGRYGEDPRRITCL